ncbi:MBL fold metallo-hydrolase [Gordonia hydrophobica]|uniref:Metallo-beta-lactamase domain-containing protein n=1 Tax=Gordonia hydrophobica TaxID=40516 RepID=A0ABZ2TXR0_9ACTN|nr:MBL fold metallo-hydrolase [Gordonia hydrophobica]MBM7366407.1 glyoxylase-like metal-dependent hydrolase (beta-lactamase superfamily II) [Gordonia hydrophobica]
MSDEQVALGPHVTRWAGPDGGRVPYGNPLTVTAGESTVLLDAGLGVATPPADLLLLSHYHEDHTVDALARASTVAIHRSDVFALQSWESFRTAGGIPEGDWEADFRRQFSWNALPDASVFDDDAVFDVGGDVRVHVVPLPGHTAGHCGFLIEPDGVFYIADVDLSTFGPMYSDIGSSLADIRATLDAVTQVQARVVVPYHHKGPYFTREEFLEDLALHAAALDAREGRLLEQLAAGPHTASDLLGRGIVYRVATAPWYADAAEIAMIRRHLDDLVSRGVVIGPDADGRFRLA